MRSPTMSGADCGPVSCGLPGSDGCSDRSSVMGEPDRACGRQHVRGTRDRGVGSDVTVGVTLACPSRGRHDPHCLLPRMPSPGARRRALHAGEPQGTDQLPTGAMRGPAVLPRQRGGGGRESAAAWDAVCSRGRGGVTGAAPHAAGGGRQGSAVGALDDSTAKDPATARASRPAHGAVHDGLAARVGPSTA